MARYDRSCILCGKVYEYCNSCSAFQDKPVWMFSYCSEDCKDITSLLTDYIYNKVSKEDAKKIIDTKDTSRHMNKNEEIKKDIVKDMASDTASQFKNNLQSESKKVYSKTIAHKHGK